MCFIDLCFPVFTVFRLLTDFFCLYTYEFWLSLCKIVRSSVILLLPLFGRLGLLPRHSLNLSHFTNHTNSRGGSRISQARGSYLKKIAPSGGRREILLGYFVWKITILRQKIIFFPILGGIGSVPCQRSFSALSDPVTRGAGTAHSSGAPEFTPGF
jgi:hypothetical protein